MYCFFVDFKAAFDKIDRNALFYKLSMMGISKKFLNVLKKMYDGMKWRTTVRFVCVGNGSKARVYIESITFRIVYE